ncbi:pirin family protein [Uliginosibacterium gangwonense]|uniref:pirin family protein n=1 Tax=Uliginosibacterium gangwonense TaxID=392736 RepID=UPI000375A381|nr:pirin family protein [Uliginosibacterium gangwonense]
MTTTLTSRSVERLVAGRATSDGAGVKLTRVLTQDLQRRLDPFLMLDAFRTDNPDDYIGGFPDHPHRGFETVTYMIAGRMRHHDNAGNSGLLGPGASQWMIAGSGLIHSELPEQEEGLMEGFQLWLNLPARNKMIAPSYRDIPSAQIPEVRREDDVLVRIIAGQAEGVAGAVQRPDTEPLFLDVHLPAGTHYSQHVPAQHNAFLYVYRGAVEVAGKTVPERSMAILANDGDTLHIKAGVDAKIILVAGQPLGEPIAQYGPFVMNTAEEIQQTLSDYRLGKIGASVVQKA